MINWIISSPGKCTLWLTFTVFSGPDLGTGAEVPTVGVGAGPTMFTRRIQALIGVYKQRNNKMASYITCTLKKFIDSILVLFYLTTKSWYIRKRGQCKEPERHIRYIKHVIYLIKGSKKNLPPPIDNTPTPSLNSIYGHCMLTASLPFLMLCTFKLNRHQNLHLDMSLIHVNDCLC